MKRVDDDGKQSNEKTKRTKIENKNNCQNVFSIHKIISILHLYGTICVNQFTC